MQMPDLSPKAMLIINLLLGTLVALANGSAVLLSALGGRGALRGGEFGEAAVWAAGGIALVVLSFVGLGRPKSVVSILEKQVVAVFALIILLAGWGLTVAMGAYRIAGTVVWSAGFLSILGLYSYVLYANVSAIRGWGKAARPFAIAFVIACIAIDVAAFTAVIKA